MLGNSITVINKSGKVVSNGKHLAAVWKEAKAAYRSKKAEIRATREAEYEEKHVRHALKNTSLSEEHLPRRAPSRAPSHAGSSRSVHRSKTTAHHQRRHSSHRPLGPNPLERGYTDSTYANDVVYSHPSQPPAFEAPERNLVRRNTLPPRPSSAGSYDEHLAYGKLPPPLPVRATENESKLRGEMSKLTQLLDEANCLQYTATTMIDHLQKNPEALAAVGLTLAEISQLARRVGPQAFLSMKTAFPAVVALLASPEFLIAGGVAVGVTVVMLGGYKIIKRVKQKKEAEDSMEVLRELEGDLSGIELWRRGIADVEAESVGTSVDGEFITPGATRRMMDEGILQQENIKPAPSHKARSERSHQSRRSASVRSSRTSNSKRGHHSRRSKSYSDEESTTSSKKDGKRKKGLSGLKLLFQGRSPA